MFIAVISRQVFLYVLCSQLVIGAVMAQATFQWTGASNTNWHDAANWNLTAGSDADGIPDEDDNVIFPVGNNINCILTANAACQNMEIQAGYVGTLNLSGFTLEVYGNWNHTFLASSFSANNGTVIFRGANNATLVAPANNYFFNLVIAKTTGSNIDAGTLGAAPLATNELIMESGTLLVQGAGEFQVNILRVRSGTSAFSSPGGRVMTVLSNTIVESGSFTPLAPARLSIRGNYQQTGGFIAGQQAATPADVVVRFEGNNNTIISGSAVVLRAAVLINKAAGASVVLSNTITSAEIQLGTASDNRNLLIQSGSLRFETGIPLVVRGSIIMLGDGFIDAFNSPSTIRLTGSWNSAASTAANPIQTNLISSVQMFGDGNVEIRTSANTRFFELIIQKNSGFTVTLDGSNALRVDNLLNVLPGTGLIVRNVVGGNFATINKPAASPNALGGSNRTYNIPAADIDVRDLIIQNGAFVNLYTHTGWGAPVTLFLRGNLVDNNTAYPSDNVGFYVSPSDISGPNTQGDNNRLPFVVFVGPNSQVINGNTIGLKNRANNPIAGLSGLYLPNVILYKDANAQFVEVPTNKGVRVMGNMVVLTGTFRLPEATLLYGNQANDEMIVYGIFEAQPGSRVSLCTGGVHSGAFLRVGNGGLVSLLGSPDKRVEVDRDGTPGQYYRTEVWPGGRLEVVYTNFNYQSSQNDGYIHNGGLDSRGGFKLHYGSILAPTFASTPDIYDYDGDGNTTEPGPRYIIVNGEPVFFNFSYCSFAQPAGGSAGITLNTGQWHRIVGARFTGSSAAGNANDRNVVASTQNSANAFGYSIICPATISVGDVCGVIRMLNSSGTIAGPNGEGWDGGENDSADPNADRIVWEEFRPVYWVGGMGSRGSGNACTPPGNPWIADPDRSHSASNNNVNGGVNQTCDNAGFNADNWNDWRNWSLRNDEYYNPFRFYPGMPKSAFNAPELRTVDFLNYIIPAMRAEERELLDPNGNYASVIDPDNDGEVNINILTDSRIPDDIFERFNVYLGRTASRSATIPANILGVAGVGQLEIEGNIVINGTNVNNGAEPRNLVPEANPGNTNLILAGNVALTAKKSIIVLNGANITANGSAKITVGQNYTLLNASSNNFGGPADVVTFTLDGNGEQEVRFDGTRNWEDFIVDKPSGTVIVQGSGGLIRVFKFHMKNPSGTARLRLSTNTRLETRDDFILDGGTFIFDDSPVFVGGSWLNNGGFVDEVILNAGSAVHFRPTVPGNYTIRTRNQVFSRVFFDKANANSIYTIEDGMRALARTVVGPTYTVQTDNVPIGHNISLQLTGLWVQSGAKLDLNPGAELLMQTDASKITAQGDKNIIIDGILEAVGKQDQYVRFSRMGNDYYRFDINGRAAVRFYNIQFVDENGVDMRDGTPDSPGITLFGSGCPTLRVGSFSDGTFANNRDVANATYLWLPSNYQTQDIFNVNFPVRLTAAGASNVRRDNAVGSVAFVNDQSGADTLDLRYQKTRFINATGVFAGEMYDRETASASWVGPADSIIIWSGQIRYWDGGGDGVSWHDPLNWTDDAVPSIEDAVIIDHRFVTAAINIVADGAFLPDNYAPTVGGFSVGGNGVSEIACRDLIIDTGGGNPINLDIIHSSGGDVEFLIQRSSPCPGGVEYGGDLTASIGVTIRTGNGFTGFFIGKGWSNAGVFDYDLEDDGQDPARVVFNQYVGSRTITTGPSFSPFWDVEFQGGYSENNDDMYIDNDFIINKATANIPVFDASDVEDIRIFVGGNWLNNEGVFLPRSGEVLFNGNGTQTITRNSPDLLNRFESFWNLTIQQQNNNDRVELNSRVLVNNLLRLDRGLVKSYEEDGTGNGREIIIGLNGAWVREVTAPLNTAFVDGPVGRIFQGSSVLSTRLNFPIGKEGLTYTGGNSPAGSDGYALQVRLTNNNPTAFTMELMNGHPEDENENGVLELGVGQPDGEPHDITTYASGINMVSNNIYWKVKNIGFPTALPLDNNPPVAAADLEEAVITLRFDAAQNDGPAPPPLTVEFPSVMADLAWIGKLSILQDFDTDDIPYLRQPTPIVRNSELEIRRGYASKGRYWRDIGGTGDLQSSILTISSEINFTTLGNSRFTFGWDFIPLPVELVSVSARLTATAQVQVDWLVTNESRIAYYAVERSNDGRNFVEIGRVAATAEGLSIKPYQYLDPSPQEGWNYYRLRVEELDGRQSYSRVVSVNVLPTGTAAERQPLQLYPNPTRTNEFFIDLPAHIQGSMHVQIYDVGGRLIQEQQLEQSGKTLHMLLHRKPEAGMYVVRVVSDKYVEYGRLVVE